MTLTEEILRRVKKNTTIFIETGTYIGGGIDAAIFAGFEQIYSIEFYEKRYLHCRRKYSGKDNIILLWGESAIELKKILDKIECQVLFWLDAHYNPLAPEQDYPIPIGNPFPLFDELEQIKQHPIKNHVILIDDRRMFTGEYNLWNSVREQDVVNKIKEINSMYEISYIDSRSYKKDIIVADVKE